MTPFKWMIYGAYGLTGQWITEQAVKEGLSPVLAGRSPEKLSNVSNQFDLSSRCVSLDDTELLEDVLQDLDAVVHAAGPFQQTAQPMIEACINTQTHYFDITGERSVFEYVFSRDREAQEAGILLISGMGYDVVPTDCLARDLTGKLEHPRELHVVLKADANPTAGTLRSWLGMTLNGGLARENGELQQEKIGHRHLPVQFPDGRYRAISAPLGDVITAWHSTGIPNIYSYVAIPEGIAAGIEPLSKWTSYLFEYKPFRRTILESIEYLFSGPEKTDRSEQAWIYACVRSGDRIKEGWLKTPEPYWFTALSCVEGIQKLQHIDGAGTRTPAQAFGADFVTQIDSVQRFSRATERT